MNIKKEQNYTSFLFSPGSYLTKYFTTVIGSDKKPENFNDNRMCDSTIKAKSSLAIITFILAN